MASGSAADNTRSTSTASSLASMIDPLRAQRTASGIVLELGELLPSRYGFAISPAENGWDWFTAEFCHPEDVSAVVDDVVSLLDGRKRLINCRFRAKDKKNKQWVDVELNGMRSSRSEEMAAVLARAAGSGENGRLTSEKTSGDKSSHIATNWHKNVLDALPFPLAIRNVDGGLVYMNRKGLEFCGIDAVTGIADSSLENWGGKLEILPTPATADPGDGIPPRYIESGTDRVFRREEEAIYDADGNCLGMAESIKDITDAHELEERTKIMLDTTPLSCIIWDEGHNTIDCNQEAVRLLGLTEKKELLARFFEFSPECQPDGSPSVPRAHEHIGNAFKYGYERFEWVHKKATGELLPAEITLVRVKRRQGYIMTSYTRDLQEIKDTRARLDSERLLLRKILDSSPICFMVTVNDVISFITPFASCFLGVRENDCGSDIFLDETIAQEIFDEVKNRGEVVWRPVTIRAAGGAKKTMLMNTFLADYYGEQGVMTWLIDVTEMQETEMELRLARDVAEASAKAKSQFLANMSHEIRTPMNAIIGLTRLVLEDGGLSAEQRDYIQQTDIAAHSLLKIINDILDFSKIEAGKIELESIEFRIVDILRNLISLVTARLSEKGLELLFAVDPALPSHFLGDPVRLGQVLANLLSNAVKFTNYGQIMVSITVEEEARTYSTLKFSIQDTGIGMDEEQISRLFSPFSQADTSITRRYGGTGLGLAIAKRLAALMGGGISCSSSKGEGSEFVFTCRLGKVQNAPPYVRAREVVREKTILLVGSHQAALDCWKSNLLLLEPAKVEVCYSWMDGIEAIQESVRNNQLPDVLVLDHDSRRQAAPDVMARIGVLINDNNLPTVLLVDSRQQKRIPMQLEQGYGMQTVVKPVLPDSLTGMVLRFFHRSTTVARVNTTRFVLSEYDLVRHLAGARILVAEDNSVNQLVVKRILQKANFEVEVAENGIEAVAMARTGNFDLVLMDIQMPEMDGLTATKKIRTDPQCRDLPILALTAHAMVGDQETSLKAGMNGHVVKPINRYELFRALAHWIKPRDDANA